MKWVFTWCVRISSAVQQGNKNPGESRRPGVQETSSRDLARMLLNVPSLGEKPCRDYLEEDFLAKEHFETLELRRVASRFLGHVPYSEEINSAGCESISMSWSTP